LGDGSFLVHIGHEDWTRVDAEALPLGLQYPWHMFRKFGKPNSVRRNTGKTSSFLHRELMGNPDCEVDHINNDPTDNRRCNLRPATRLQNARNVGMSKRNRSGFKGVSWSSKPSKWQVFLAAKWLGNFEDVREAGLAYDIAALRGFGAFAKLNDRGRTFRALSHQAFISHARETAAQALLTPAVQP